MRRQPKRDLKDLIRRLAPVTYPTLRLEYTADCCIAAASILTRVLEEYGHKAQVIPVTVEVYNAAMVRLLKRGVQIPTDRVRREMFFDLTGAYGLGIMPYSAVLSALNDVRGGGYGGHLLVRAGEFLIDATIKQTERPARGVIMPDMIATEHAQDLMRDGVLELSVGGCCVIYRRINDESFRTAPDWVRRATPYPETVRRIIQKVEAVSADDQGAVA